MGVYSWESEGVGEVRILVACEYSGIVRDAFAARGHDAWSCDIIPTESPGNHIQGDVLDILNDGWDMMIAHPPCTYLTNAGNRWLFESCATSTPEQRHIERDKAIEFVQALQAAPIEKIAIENPQPHPYVIERIGPYQDKLQPYNFGDEETKGICLWLKNLPPLLSTMTTTIRVAKTHLMGGANRRKERSKFFPGVAAAMAAQWG